jgi:tetratricopeptide (TPR) repeat protein
MLRKILGSDRNTPVYIDTISKIGYRFVAPVRKTPRNTICATSVAKAVPKNGIRQITSRYSFPITAFIIVGFAFLGLVALGLFKGGPIIWASRSNKNVQPSAENTGSAATKGAMHEEAHQSYLAGRYYGKRRTHETLYRSVEYYQQALLKDPHDAQAYSGLADAYSSLTTFETEPIQQKYSLAKEAAAKAVQLGGSLAETHTSVGIVLFRFEWNWSRAEAELRRAIELDANYPTSYIILANCLAAQGRLDEALEGASRAVQIDPLSRDAYTELGRVYYWRREYDRSISALRHAIDLDPYYARAHTRLGETYAVSGDYVSALREFRTASQLYGSDPYLEGFAGYAEGRSGDLKLARERLGRLIQRSHREYIPGFSIALIFLGIGDHDRALYWLQQAYRDRSEAFIFAFVDPKLDLVRPEPAFVELLGKMDLAKARGDFTSSVTSDLSRNTNFPSR